MNSSTPFILTSEQDKNIFFKGILHPAQPGTRLVAAAKRYRKLYDHPGKLESIENKPGSGS